MWFSAFPLVVFGSRVSLKITANLLRHAINPPNIWHYSEIGASLLRLAKNVMVLFTNRQMATGFVECFECSHGCKSLSYCCCAPIVPECNAGLFQIPINEWRSCHLCYTQK